MNIVGTNINSYMDSMKKESDQSLQVQTNSTNIQTRQAQSAEMELMTKEGDKVTLSFTSAASSGYSTYNQNGRLGDTSWSTSMESMYSETESNTQIKIEGDLNKEELKDILKAVKKLEKAMNKMVNGNTDGAVESLLDAAGGKTISSFNSAITFSKSIEIEKQYQAVSMSELPKESSSSVNEPSQTDTALSEKQPVNLNNSAKQTDPQNYLKTEMQKLIEELKDAANKSRIPTSVLRPSFEKMFDKKIEGADKNELKDSGIMDFFKQMKKNLLDGLSPDNKKVNTMDEE